MKTLIAVSHQFDRSVLLDWTFANLPWTVTELHHCGSNAAGRLIQRWRYDGARDGKRYPPGSAYHEGAWSAAENPFAAMMQSIISRVDAALVLWDGECLDMQQVIRDCSEAKLKMVTHVYPMASTKYFPLT